MAKRGKKKTGLDAQGWKDPEPQPDEAQADPVSVVPENVVHGRFNEHSPAGPSTSRQVLPDRAEPDPIVLPEPEEAVRLLGELAAQGQRVQAARKRLEEAQALVKARRGTVDEEAIKLERMLTSATQPKPLPLFDAAQSEADLRQMEQAIDAAAAETQGAPEEAAEGDSGGSDPIAAPGPANAETAGPVVADPAEVF